MFGYLACTRLQISATVGCVLSPISSSIMYCRCGVSRIFPFFKTSVTCSLVTFCKTPKLFLKQLLDNNNYYLVIIIALFSLKCKPFLCFFQLFLKIFIFSYYSIQKMSFINLFPHKKLTKFELAYYIMQSLITLSFDQTFIKVWLHYFVASLTQAVSVSTVFLPFKRPPLIIIVVKSTLFLRFAI